MLSVRSPFGVWPAGLCAKSLRRSGEMALKNHSTPFWNDCHDAYARAGRESPGEKTPQTGRTSSTPITARTRVAGPTRSMRRRTSSAGAPRRVGHQTPVREYGWRSCPIRPCCSSSPASGWYDEHGPVRPRRARARTVVDCGAGFPTRGGMDDAVCVASVSRARRRKLVRDAARSLA
jgi:hypothetical protein